MDAELAEDLRDVVALRADADLEPVGDRLGVEAGAERLERFAFARREALDRATVVALLLAPVAGEPQQLGDLVGGEQRLLAGRP